jgi:hypothetical protein
MIGSEDQLHIANAELVCHQLRRTPGLRRRMIRRGLAIADLAIFCT